MRPVLDYRHASGVRVSVRVADGVIIDAPWEQKHDRQREEGETADGRFHRSCKKDSLAGCELRATGAQNEPEDDRRIDSSQCDTAPSAACCLPTLTG